MLQYSSTISHSVCFLRASSNDLKIDEVAVEICITCGYPEVHGINHQSKQLSTESGGLNLIPFIVFRRQTRRRGGDVFLRGDGVDAGASTHLSSLSKHQNRETPCWHQQPVNQKAIRLQSAITALNARLCLVTTTGGMSGRFDLESLILKGCYQCCLLIVVSNSDELVKRSSRIDFLLTI